MRGRLRRLLLVVAAVLGLFMLYEGATSVVAYTDDGFVRSDLVAVAPEVTGRVVAVHVVDNQEVKVGDRLVSLDPVPFELVVGQRQAQIDQARALVAAAQDELAAAQADLASASAAHAYAVQTQAREMALVRSADAPRAALDKATDDLRRAEAGMAVSQTMIARAQATIIAQQAAQTVAAAEMATARWRLSRTEVLAPVAGPIVNLTVRPGDTATADVPLIGIVDNAGWRIVANYKQSYVRGFEVGGTGWVWLDSHPWRFARARITGIARGISREAGQEKLLPYVAPTTEWIRLQRRLPVTLVLEEPPPGGKLYMGADARVVIFP